MKTAVLMIALGLALQAGAEDRAPDWTANCGDEERDLQVLSRQQPYYPHSALMFCLTGDVRAAFTVDPQGMPRDVRIVESQPSFVFDRAVVDAIISWRFAPACREGEAVDREAVQTIQFRLPAEAGERCAEMAGELDDRQLELVADIGARYALLAEQAQDQHAREEVEAAVGAPFDAFDGDLGRVASFHRQVLTSRPPEIESRRLFDSGQRLSRALQPEAIAENPSLDPARRRLRDFRAALNAWLNASQDTYADLAANYASLERDTGLEPSTLELLVIPFTGDFGMPFDEWAAPLLETVERAEAIVSFLEEQRSSWRPMNGAVHFDNEADARVWAALRQDLIDHQTTLEAQHLAVLRSFNDYSR